MAAQNNSNAALRVLDTTELLESIIQHLPPNRILIVQQVSKKWRDCLNESVLLKRKLYIASENGEAVAPHRAIDLAKYKPEHKAFYNLAIIDHRRPMDNCDTALTPNPLLRPHESPLYLGEFFSMSLWHLYEPYGTMTNVNASWCRMFLTQPPTTQLVIGKPPRVVRVVNPDGITAQDMVNAMALKPAWWEEHGAPQLEFRDHSLSARDFHSPRVPSGESSDVDPMADLDALERREDEKTTLLEGEQED